MPEVQLFRLVKNDGNAYLEVIWHDISNANRTQAYKAKVEAISESQAFPTLFIIQNCYY